MGNFDFDGIDGIERMFEQLGVDIEKVDKQALKAGGKVIAEKQRELVNRSGRDQAHIEDNITVSVVRDSDEGKYVDVKPNKKVMYRAKFLELGTSKMPAYPFIEKSGDEGEAEAIRAMKKVYMDVMPD